MCIRNRQHRMQKVALSYLDRTRCSNRYNGFFTEGRYWAFAVWIGAGDSDVGREESRLLDRPIFVVVRRDEVTEGGECGLAG